MRTDEGAIVGTPEYMAPEQSNGKNDYRSDIYSLGIIAYQMLTGRVPFTAESPVAISLKHIQTPPTPPRELNSSIPEGVEEVILKALAKEPGKRYQAAQELATAYWKALQKEQATTQGNVNGSIPAEAKPPAREEEQQARETVHIPITRILPETERALRNPPVAPFLGAGTVLYITDLTKPGGGWINDGHQCYFSPHAAAWCYTNQLEMRDAVITAQAQLLRGDSYGSKRLLFSFLYQKEIMPLAPRLFLAQYGFFKNHSKHIEDVWRTSTKVPSSNRKQFAQIACYHTKSKKFLKEVSFIMSLNTKDTVISPLFPGNGHPSSTTHTIYLALGSNLGDRRGNLAAALQQLREIMDITSVSSLYETEPVGYSDQPRFLNMVCSGTTTLSAQELLKRIKQIEVGLGRQPSFRNGPRPIDIDILFFDDLKMAQEQLTIPHPRMRERAFVLIPLTEIAPDSVDPVSGKTATELLTAVSQEGVTKLSSTLRIPLENDIQSGSPAVHVRLGRTGVVGIKKSLLLGEEDQQQWFDATFDLYADLGPTQAGVHMSRFSESLEEVIEDIGITAWPRIELLAEHMARTIVKKQKVERAEVHIRTAYPLQKWTPVSGHRLQEVYGLIAQAVATPTTSRRMVGVEVEGMVACPCAQDMVHSFAQLRLREEGFPEDVIEKMLSVTPLATHNQRGRATLLLGSAESVDARDLVMLVEGAMSSENYSLLKRPDELYIVNKAHSNPRFVEDVVREILRGVVEKYMGLSDDTFVWVHQRNEETIHKYDVEAEGWGTLRELRAEILGNASVSHHTTKEAWLLQ